MNTTAAATAKPRAYSYLRFSTPEQMQGDSFRRQSTMAEEWCRRNGIELDTELTFQDLGVSGFRGANAETGKLRKFREAVEEGDIAKGSYLLLENLDRLTRLPPLQAVNLLADIAREGVNVVTLSDGKTYDRQAFDGSNNMDILIAFIVAMRANDESMQKSRRLKAAWSGLREKAQDGYKITSRIPNWLRLTDDRKGFDVVEEKAEVVRRIFTMAAGGMGPQAIAKALNSEEAPKLTGDTAQFWHRATVFKLLRASSVIGTYTPTVITYDDETKTKGRQAQEPIEDYYPAIVDRETFDTVKAILAGHRASRGTGYSRAPANLLGSLALCPLCGGAVTRVNKGDKKRSKPKLVCSRAKSGAGCTYHSVDYETVERVLIDNVSWLVGHAPSKDAGIDASLAKARSLLEVIEEQLERTVNAIVEVGSSVALTDKLRALEADKIETHAEIDALEEKAHGANTAVLQKRLNALEEALTAGDVVKGNAALRMLLSSIVIDYRTRELALNWKHDGETRITYAMDPVPAKDVAEARDDREESIRRASRATVTEDYLAAKRGQNEGVEE